MTRIDTHTYSGSKRTELRELAEKSGQNLWMSEIDGDWSKGTDAGIMGPGLGFADEIINDLNNLRPSAWIMWNAVDTFVDADNTGLGQWDPDSFEEFETLKFRNDNGIGYKGAYVYNPEKMGFWGISIGDFNTKTLNTDNKKYYAYGQFSKFIRPGYTIIGGGANTAAAYDSKGKKVVIVAMNTAGEEQTTRFRLDSFVSVGDVKQAVRTSLTENWNDILATEKDSIVVDQENRTMVATLPANSITTYVIDGVDYDKEQDISNVDRKLQEVELKASNVDGSDPWNNNSANGPAKVVDGDPSTFFDGVNDGWVSIDLEKETEIAALEYAPRSGYAGRVIGASFYGSNDGTNWDNLYTIFETPSGTYGRINAEDMNVDKASYRYIKYAVPSGDYNCNVAEIKVYTYPAHEYEVMTELPAIAASEEDLMKKLPKTVSVKVDGTLQEEEVSYHLNTSADMFGEVQVRGTYGSTGDSFYHTVTIFDPNLIYMFASADATEGTLATIKKSLGSQILNQDFAQTYSYDNGGGIASYIDDSDNADASIYQGSSMWNQGYWARNGKNIVYKCNLTAGNYIVYSGFYEWWNNRKIKITAKDGEGAVLAQDRVALNNSGDKAQSAMKLTVSQDTCLNLEITKDDSESSDPVVSWVAVAKDVSTPSQTPSVKPSQTPSVKPEKITVSVAGTSFKIAAGKKVSLSPKVTPSSACSKVTYVVSNSKYASIDSKGVVTTKKAGSGKTVTISIKEKNGSKVYKRIYIKIMKDAVKSITVKAPKTLKAGKKVTLKPSIKSTGKNLKYTNTALAYTVSNSKYASISSKGVLTAKKAGIGKTVTVKVKPSRQKSSLIKQ